MLQKIVPGPKLTLCFFKGQKIYGGVSLSRTEKKKSQLAFQFWLEYQQKLRPALLKNLYLVTHEFDERKIKTSLFII